MTIEISVKRQKSPDEKSYVQTFNYEGDGNLTIADWLTEVNKNEAKTDRITWECGCHDVGKALAEKLGYEFDHEYIVYEVM